MVRNLQVHIITIVDKWFGVDDFYILATDFSMQINQITVGSL